MHRTLLHLALALSVQGCGDGLARLAGAHTTLPDRFIDAELQPFLDQFLADADAHGAGPLNLGRLRRIQFVAGSEGADLRHTAGSCRSEKVEDTALEEGSEWRIIAVVLPLQSHPLSLRWVMYHELGHCLLDRHHATEADGSRNIMDPSQDLRNLFYNDAEWARLVDALFAPAEPAP